MPAPTLVSEPPVPPLNPPSLITPDTVVLVPFPPVVSTLLPRKYLPLPAIEPIFIPVEVSALISTNPLPLVVACAAPPSDVGVK